MSQPAQTTIGTRRLIWAIALMPSVLLFSGTAKDLRAQTHACPKLADIQGAWEDRDAKTSILFDTSRLVLDENHLSVAAILKDEPCRLTVRHQDLRASWNLSETDHGLDLRRGEKTLHLTKLASVPARLELRPMTLGTAAPESKEKVAEITSELTARFTADQEAEKKAAKGSTPELEKVFQDNTGYLTKLLTKYGWIDIDRFGKASSSAALLLAKHGGELPIMMAVLPIAEADARKHHKLGELISVLYDSTRITLGDKQRYGTQIVDGADGHGLILPVEDRTKVDIYRKELDIPTWAEYIDMASKYLYDGKPIRIAGDDE